MAKRTTPARPCTVCAHASRAQIEIGLVHGIAAAALAARFPDLSKDAIWRHGKNHLSPVQRAAILQQRKPSAIDLDKLKVAESEGLLANLVAQRARLQQTAEMALEFGDVKANVSAESAITANLALVGKLLGQLVNIYDVRQTSITLTPDYLRMREVLVRTLRPYPEAARAVSAALYALECDAARDITPAKAAPVVDHVPAALPPPPC